MGPQLDSAHTVPSSWLLKGTGSTTSAGAAQAVEMPMAAAKAAIAISTRKRGFTMVEPFPMDMVVVCLKRSIWMKEEKGLRAIWHVGYTLA